MPESGVRVRGIYRAGDTSPGLGDPRLLLVMTQLLTRIETLENRTGITSISPFQADFSGPPPGASPLEPGDVAGPQTTLIMGIPITWDPTVDVWSLRDLARQRFDVEAEYIAYMSAFSNRLTNPLLER